MADSFQLEIVTPDKQLVNERAEEAQIPGKGGYFGVLPGHAPLISELAVGEISYKADGQTKRLAVAWGFAEVLPEKVTILAETAERAEDIDIERARKAKERAELLLKERADNLDEERARIALERAQSRLEVAEKK